MLVAFLSFFVGVLGILQLGCVYTEKSWTNWYPDYEKEDITGLLEKESLSDEEYGFLYRQTGLTRLAVDDMRKSSAGKSRILKIQEVFFTDYTVKSRVFAPFTYMEEINGYATLCKLKDGDIILSASTRVSWWRYGHAAIVVDGEAARIAEAISPGTVSRLADAASFTYTANFLVLRPKADAQLKAQLAEYVKAELLGVPYRLTTGVFSKKFPKTLKSSQCAHFVWYAYKKFGIDLDSNGGKVVKPQDIALSDKVELVQAYGFDLNKLWS